MRISSRGILIENGKILLIHRIKDDQEYYVVPGGGIENLENYIETVIRELKEEVGINVQVLNEKPIMKFKDEIGIQYYFLVRRISGNIGSGNGPEFNSPDYANKGNYIVDLIDIKDIDKINLVPISVKNELINIINNLNKDISILESNDLVYKKTINLL